MRTFLRGLLIGVVLSMLRAPRGLDLFQLPVAASGTTLLWRASALALVGLVFFVALRRPGFGLLASAAAGFALHGLVLAAWITPGSTLAFVLTALAAVAGALLVCLDERKLQEPPEAVHPNRAAFVGELIGLFAAGAGAAIALEAVARHVRLFGAGSAQDDSVFGCTFLALVALGALALGPLARWPKLRNLTLPTLLAFAALAAYVPLIVVRDLVKTPTLTAFLKTFGLSLGDHGTLLYDVVIASVLFAAPALVLGAALAGGRNGRQLCALCAGAAQGLLLSGSLLVADSALDTTQSSMFSAQLIPTGILIASAGAALAVLSAAGPGKFARYSLLVLALVPCLASLGREDARYANVLPALQWFGRPALPVAITSPWDDSSPTAPRMFQLSLEVPEGLLTVESTPSGSLVATLDRHVLSTSAEDAVAEVERLHASLACVPQARRAAGKLSVLIVGQLDPLRATLLGQQGCTTIDRSAPWHAAMDRVERRLFDKLPRPQGEILAPAQARERIAAARYDLVLVPPVDGDPPRMGSLDVPESTVLVAWSFADAPLARVELGSEVLLPADGLHQPAAAVTLHAEKPRARTIATPHFARAGARGSAELPLANLLRRESYRDRSRSNHAISRSFERFADAATDESAAFLRGLADIAAAQSPSSPFEKSAQQIELPEHALDELQPFALQQPPDAFVRSVWSGIARLLVEKRDVPRLRKYVEPLANAHKPWPELEKALARADLESLEPASAVKRLESVAVLAKDDFEFWVLLGDARNAAKDVQGASTAFGRALELRPGRYELRRRLAIAWMKLDDARGKPLVEELLTANPNDANLRAFLGPRPWPED